MVFICPKAVKAAMIASCLDVVSLSRTSSLGVSTINRLVNHGGKFRLSTIGKLARALDVQPETLIVQEKNQTA